MAEDRLRRGIPYEALDPDRDFYLPNGNERKRKLRRACDSSFEAFVRLRGDIVSQAIAVEQSLDEIIAAYFVRGASRDSVEDEERIRAHQLNDLLLGQPAVTFACKRDIVAAILPAAEVSKDGFKETLTPDFGNP